jgi:hypothetical protein
MGNEKEGSTVFSYKAPAIIITERNGDVEKVLEFATADDYAAYKQIEAEAWMADKQKYDAAVKKACEAARSAIDEISKRTYWHAMCKHIKI